MMYMNTRNPAAYRTYRKDVVVSSHISKMRSSYYDVYLQSCDVLVECAKPLLVEYYASLPDLGIDLEAVDLAFYLEKYDDRDTVVFYDLNSLRDLLLVEFYKNGMMALAYILDEDEE